MNHRLIRLAATSLLLTTAPVILADTTIIHAGELLAVPGQAVSIKQTIVIEDERIVEIRKGYSNPGEFDGEVTVIDLKDRFVLPGLMAGFTTVRDAGSSSLEMYALRDGINKGWGRKVASHAHQEDSIIAVDGSPLENIEELLDVA